MSKKLSRQERRAKALRRLENVEIVLESPCPVRWEDMKGDDSIRECTFCQLTVYNFVGMSPSAILDAIDRHQGRLCAQFYVRSDGTVMLASCSTRDEHLTLARGGLVVN